MEPARRCLTSKEEKEKRVLEEWLKAEKAELIFQQAQRNAEQKKWRGEATPEYLTCLLKQSSEDTKECEPNKKKRGRRQVDPCHCIYELFHTMDSRQ